MTFMKKTLLARFPPPLYLALDYPAELHSSGLREGQGFVCTRGFCMRGA